MFEFSIGDLIYYVSNNAVAYGVCTALNYTDNVLTSYTVANVENPQETATVTVANAYPSGYDLIASVTPTPSPSVGTTGTPTVSPTPSMSFTPSPQVPTNLFPTSTTGWTATNGSIALANNNTQLLLTSTSTSATAYPTFTQNITIQPNTYYKFNLRNIIGTVGNASIFVYANSTILYGVAPTPGETLFNEQVSNSTDFHLVFNSQEATEITVVVTLFSDASFSSAAAANYTYTLANTYLAQDYNYVAVTPTPSVSATSVSPTPTPSVSPTISVTPSITPTISVTPSVTPTHSGA
jgi:hypothetical protein